MDKIEFLILKNLLHNEDYLRKVVPFLKGEYFQDNNQKIAQNCPFIVGEQPRKNTLFKT